MQRLRGAARIGMSGGTLEVFAVRITPCWTTQCFPEDCESNRWTPSVATKCAAKTLSN